MGKIFCSAEIEYPEVNSVAAQPLYVSESVVPFAASALAREDVAAPLPWIAELSEDARQERRAVFLGDILEEWPA